MEAILNQQEISDLLAAIKAGTVPLEFDDDGAGGFLPCTALNLFEAAHKHASDNRVANFDLIVDAFAKNYSIALTNKLQRTCYLQRLQLDSMPFQDFLAKHSNPGAIGLFSMQPIHHSALVVLDNKLSFSLVEIMLGASRQISPLQLERELTTIELTILKAVLSEASNNLDRAFSPIIDLRSGLEKVEKNVRMVSIAEADADVIVASFQLTMDDLNGEIDFLLPAAALEPLREKLKDLLNVNISTQDSWKDSVQEELKKSAALIIAQSGLLTLSVDRVLRMQVGDIIPLDYDPNAPLKILVEDQLKFFGRPGSSNGRKAVSITGVYQ